MVGSAIVRQLQAHGYHNLLVRTSKELDLRNQEDVWAFFQQEKPDYVFLAAAKVGGIIAGHDYKSHRGEEIAVNSRFLVGLHKRGVSWLFYNAAFFVWLYFGLWQVY